MGYIEAIILGLIQGLAEFLPISSSGHLALAQHFFDVNPEKVMMFTVMLHIGTLVSVFIVYWKDIVELVKELILTIKDLATGKGLRLSERPFRKLGLMIIVATIPTALIGFLFEDFFTGLNSKLWAIGIGFLFTGTILFISERVGKSMVEIDRMKFRNAIFIGIMQGIAICPGVSRSGSTMFGGLISGLKRDFAVRFAFLISIPSILGAAVLELPEAVKSLEAGMNYGPLLIGMAVAAVSGLIAIRAMIRVVVNQKLKYFSIYVWIIGVATLVYGLLIR